MNPPLNRSDSEDIPSPCIGVCTVDDETGFCLGCARTLHEVARWKRLSPDEKKQVVSQLPARKDSMVSLGVDVRWRR